MCRVALLSKNGFKKLDKEYGVVDFFNFLERQCGGHGNGFALVKDSKILYAAKGLKLTNEEIYKFSKNKSWDYLIYHTRISSAGTVNDANCHPFWNKKKSLLLCMNGTEGGFAALGRKMNKTDTELIFDNINSKIIRTDDLLALSANYIGFEDGNVFVVNNNRMNCLEFYEDSDSLILASSFPKDYKIKTKEMALTIWKSIDGEVPENVPLKRDWWEAERDRAAARFVNWEELQSGDM